eukprot:jgi/Chlat1/7260/Chrsp58S06897
MAICVECGSAVSDLYKDYSQHGSASAAGAGAAAAGGGGGGGGGGNIRLTRCAYCHRYADKYVEYEPMHFATALCEWALFIASILMQGRLFKLNSGQAALPGVASALLTSSFFKFLFPLMAIWDFEEGTELVVNALVLTSNVVAVKVFLHASTTLAVAMVGSAALMRLSVRPLMHMLLLALSTK